jgi:ADP-ribose pyrophosphatase
MTCQDGPTVTHEPLVPREIARLYQGRIFSVQAETFDRPDGGTFTAEIIRHPGSVVIVPVTDADDVVLVRQYRHAIGRFAWELPAGSLKPGEDVAQAAGRECQEEIGLVASRLTPLGAFFRADGLRQPTADEVAQPDEDEAIEARAFSRDVIRRMIAGGDIIDLKTVAGLALLDRR